MSLFGLSTNKTKIEILLHLCMHFKHVENQVRLSTETQNDIKWLLFAPPRLNAYRYTQTASNKRLECMVALQNISHISYMLVSIRMYICMCL